MFASAAKEFEKNLPESDRGLFSKVETPESLVDDLTAYIEHLNTPHRSRLHDAIRKIALFGDSFAPYFTITHIIVSSHPEYAAIAWGAVRLVFQVCTEPAFVNSIQLTKFDSSVVTT